MIIAGEAWLPCFLTLHLSFKRYFNEWIFIRWAPPLRRELAKEQCPRLMPLYARTHFLYSSGRRTIIQSLKCSTNVVKFFTSCSGIINESSEIWFPITFVFTFRISRHGNLRCLVSRESSDFISRIDRFSLETQCYWWIREVVAIKTSTNTT